MPKQPVLVAALLSVLMFASAVATADARIPIRVGIGDQRVAMFDQAAFQKAKFKRVRYILKYNAFDNPEQKAEARAYVLAAKKQGISVLIHLNTDNFDIKKGHLPTVKEYRREVRRIVPYFRKLGVREFGVWNEVNHASQPTYRSATRSADFFKEMYRAVKPKCKICGIVALDVLDQRGVEKYMRSFYRRLGKTYTRRATVVGIHNYSDVNRKRIKNSYTGKMISQARKYNKRTRFWITETGGVVKFGKSFPCSQERAKNRMSTMFQLAKKYRRSGVQRLYPYSWTGSDCDARFDAGLTNPDGSVRPAYTYLRKKMAQYQR